MVVGRSDSNDCFSLENNTVCGGAESHQAALGECACAFALPAPASALAGRGVMEAWLRCPFYGSRNAIWEMLQN